MLKTLRGSVSAGLLIAIGGSVFLATENRYVGAILFSVALLCICYKSYYLFTGKVGYLPESHDKDFVIHLIVGLLGNLVTTFLLGLLLSVAIPNLGEAAKAVCSAKLNQSFWQTLVRGTFCGVLMYLAVSIFRDKKTPLAILFCIPVFILSGFEHSIADMFYFGASGIYELSVVTFMLAVIAGNSLGAVILPLLNPEEKKSV